MARVSAAAYTLSCLAVGCHAFISSPPSSRSVTTGTAVGTASCSGASSCLRGVSTERDADSSSAFGIGSLAAGVTGLLTAAAGVSRANKRRSARNITLQQINELTLKDVPRKWLPWCSVKTARDNKVVKSISDQLKKTFFIMAWNKDGMDTDSLEAARAMFPAGVKVRNLRNKLVREAMGESGWGRELGMNFKGSCMYVFVENEEDVKPTMQAYAKMEKSMRRQQVLDQLIEKNPNSYKSYKPIPFWGGGLAEDKKFMDPEQAMKLKDMPTKLDLIARVAGAVKQVPQKLAVGINQLPKKIAVGTKKIVEKMEEEGKSTVSELA
eukprot:TRINITY_DN8112_c0_g1_i1.p1 TRINITY_DN8112_c0_g1~~TRINITY_DN8112_c0_g1_i1.p1  ORF type:complete len:324 (+),score=105.25 TRINITY_DN8112_c0_g1_i1:157-1128(+)